LKIEWWLFQGKKTKGLMAWGFDINKAKR
jgi:hypothetical protein